jgi:phage-related protein
MARDKKVSISIIGKTKQFTDSLTKSQKAMQGFSNVAGKIGKATAAGLGIASVAAVTLGKELVDLGSDANEARAAFETTFGESVPRLTEFVGDFANMAGLAGHELEGLLTQSGAILQGIDMTADASANLSMDLATLAGDVASFSNVQGGAEPVMQAFTKALLGERESLKTYGIAIMEADVQQQAFLMTGKESASELTKQEKALATYELLLQKTKVQQGDLNRTQESFANKSRAAQAKLKDLKVTMGAELLPVVEELLPVIVDLVQEVGPHLVDAIKAVAPFIQVVGELLSALAPPIIAVVTLMLTLLAPAFKKMTEMVDKFLKPFFVNLPKNFENMINRIINSLNGFIRTINGFVDRVAGVLGKIGVNINLPKLSEIGNVSFGFAEKEVARLTPAADTIIDPAETMAALTATTQAQQAALLNPDSGLTVNFNKPVSDPNAVVDALSAYTRRNGPLGRVLTIQ